MHVRYFFLPITHGGYRLSYACIVYLCTIFISPIILFLVDYFRLRVLDPLFLVCTFLHELSHALACWLTCGKVKKIHVDPNKGGYCRTSGGVQAIILPAGYIGSCFWGSLCIVCAPSKIANDCLLIFFVILLLIVVPMFFDGLLTLILGIMMITICILLLVVSFRFPQYRWCNMIFILVFGTLNALYAIRDIVDDNIKKRPDGQQSDAAALARHVYGAKVCWGVIFALISITIWVIAVLCGWCVCVHYGMLFPGETYYHPIQYV